MASSVVAPLMACVSVASASPRVAFPVLVRVVKVPAAGVVAPTVPLMELKVTQAITQDDRIFLSMNVKKDEIAGFVSTSIGDVPQINKRELNTAVLVENGQTVVLGGVYHNKSP